MGGINVRGFTLGSVGGSRRGHLSFVGECGQVRSCGVKKGSVGSPGVIW